MELQFFASAFIGRERAEKKCPGDRCDLEATGAVPFGTRVYSDVTTHVSLISRLADSQDIDAWREFHDRYAELLRVFARRRGLQASDCDDIVQEVLASLAKSLPGFEYDPGKGKFRSYLKTITLHAIFRKSSQKSGDGQLRNIDEATRAASDDESVDSVWESEWRDYHLRQAMRVIAAEFNERDRAAFQLYAVEGRPVDEVVEQLGMSADAVYQAKSRILKRLSAVIESQVADEG